MQIFIILSAIAFCLASAREESVFSDDLRAVKNYKNSKIPILTERHFEIFENSLNKIQNLDCKSDLNATLLGIAEGLPWAIAMYDSSVKVPTGIESGSVYQIGDFDECVNAGSYDDQGLPGRVASKYCLADVSVDGLYVRSRASRNYQPSNTTLVYWAVCVPSSCNGYDIETLMEDLLGYEVHLDESKCYESKEFEATRGMIIYGCVILCLVMMALFSSLYHCFSLMGEKSHKQKDHGYFDMVMRSFSIIENLQKLFQGGNDHLGLNSINGIKALLMLLIICGHTLLFVVGGPILNADFLAIDIRKVQNAFLLNSILFVDTFLLLSGFLFCRILLRELERRQGNINIFILYIFRYIRLTPAYLAVIGFYMTWFPVIGSGPLWNHKITLEQQRCEKSWWLNLLYVNNYIGDDSLCMFQSWYLSADTQLFIIAPAIIYLLWKAKRAGIWVLSILAAFSTILPFVLTYVQNLDPTLLVFPDEVSDITTNKFFVNNYVKTHMRTTGYVFGLFIGFILHNMQEKGIILPRKLVWILWAISTLVGLGSMFSVTVFYVFPYTPLESALYAGLHRLGWSFATGWLVLAATTGNAGFLKPFLASRFFAPLSRLTYCAYLTNGIVELYQLGTLRTPVYMSHVNLLGVTTAHGGYTVITALILCLLFESPIHGIEKIFLKRDSQRQHIENRTGEGTPSTSEDSA